MLLKLICKNNHRLDVPEENFRENPEWYNYCGICGAKFTLYNTEGIVKQDLQQKAKRNIDLWFKTLGIEYTIEIIERNKNQACYRLYREELERRGLKWI